MSNNGSSPATIPSLPYWIALVGCAGLTILTGLAYGKLSQRWGPPVDLVEAGKRLETMPKEIGNWELIEEQPMSSIAIRQLACEGYVNRRYLNSQTGESVSVALLVGPSGPVAVHTPEICYSSRAYSIESPRKVADLTSPKLLPHSFWNVTFESNNATADRLRVYYAWNCGDGWVASASPRFEFAASPMLYKLQLATYLSDSSAESGSDAGQQFLQDLVDCGWKLSPS